MRRLAFLLGIVVLFSLTFVSPMETWQYNYLDQGDEVQYDGNYTINVNNTDHFDGYTVASLWNYYEGFVDNKDATTLQDAKDYTDDNTYWDKSGSSIFPKDYANINLGQVASLTGVSYPIYSTDATPKSYVDSQISSNTHWTRTGTTLSPETSGDDLDLGTGDLTTTETGTFGNLNVDTLNFNENTISDNTGTIDIADNVDIIGSLSATEGANIKTGTSNFGWEMTETTLTGNNFPSLKPTSLFGTWGVLEGALILADTASLGATYLYLGNHDFTDYMELSYVHTSKIATFNLQNLFKIQSDTEITGTLDATGLATFTNVDVDTLNFNGNTISDSTGTISFSNEDLTTTGKGTFGTLDTTGLATFTNVDVDTLNFNGNVISDSTGTISFSDEDLTTTGDLTVAGDVLYKMPHLFGISDTSQDMNTLETWQEIVFNYSLGDNNDFLDDGNCINVTKTGHYFANLEVHLVDDSPSPTSYGAIRITQNGNEISGSYSEISFTKQGAEQEITTFCYIEALEDDTICMEWIGNDIDIRIHDEGMWATQNVTAKGFINWVHPD